ncbi:MAG: hypothetical protein R3A47_10430 [Polyangiales bacterium]
MSISASVEALPSSTRTVEVITDATRLYSTYGFDAIRRGAVVKGTRLEVARKVYAWGCRWSTAYYQLTDGFFICADQVIESDKGPFGVAQPPMKESQRLPLEYAFVRDDETPYFRSPEDYFEGGDPTGVLYKGFRCDRGWSSPLGRCEFY